MEVRQVTLLAYSPSARERCLLYARDHPLASPLTTVWQLSNKIRSFHFLLHVEYRFRPREKIPRPDEEIHNLAAEQKGNGRIASSWRAGISFKFAAARNSRNPLSSITTNYNDIAYRDSKELCNPGTPESSDCLGPCDCAIDSLMRQRRDSDHRCSLDSFLIAAVSRSRRG